LANGLASLGRDGFGHDLKVYRYRKWPRVHLTNLWTRSMMAANGRYETTAKVVGRPDQEPAKEMRSW